MTDRIDFFIAGVQKGGTTALDAYLRQHPSIQMAKVKEVHHFDDESGVDWSCPSHDRLHEQFDWSVSQVIRGEATPIYTYWPASLERIQTYHPGAKLIVGLRHPAFRAYSHWKMETKRNADQIPFALAVSDEGRKRVSSAPNGVHRVYSYIERGFYSDQIERLFDSFPRRRVHFFRTDDLWRDTANTLNAITDFLGVPHFPRHEAEPRYVVPIDTREMDGLDRLYQIGLTAIFEEDLIKTARLTNLDLDDWLDLKYQEPMHAT